MVFHNFLNYWLILKVFYIKKKNFQKPYSGNWILILYQLIYENM